MKFIFSNKKSINLLWILILFTKAIYAQLTLPYTFENNSRYSDDEIYIGLVGLTEELGDVWMEMSNSEIRQQSFDLNTIPGPEWSQPADWLYPDIFTPLSEIENNTIQIPQGLYGCRIFISFESPMYLRFHETGGYAGANLSSDSDPNTGIRWEIVELTWGDSGLWTNTSRVDAYQYPMGLEVNGFFGGINPNLTYEEQYNAAINGAGTPQFKRIGEVLSHQEILDAWDNTVSTPYLAAKIVKPNSIDGEPIIEQPSKVAEFPDNILDEYIDDIWETYRNNDLVINIGDRGTWTGRVTEDDIFEFTDPSNGNIATIYGKPSTIDALEGAGFLAQSFSLNTDVQTNDLMIQAQISAAITRHAIYTDIIDGSIQFNHDADRFFQIEPYNEYVKFFHDEAISFESQTYAFAYDDVGDHSSTIQSTFPTDVKVIIGGYAEERDPAELTSVVVSPEAPVIYVGQELQLEAQGLDQYGEPFETVITWSLLSGSSTLTEDGLFSANETGFFIVNAVSDNENIDPKTTVIEVIEPPTNSELNSIQIVPEENSIQVNEELQLMAQGYDQFQIPFETNITWSANGGDISEDGLFSSNESGEFIVTATSGTISETAIVLVNETPLELNSIQITPNQSSILTNEELQLTAQAFDQFGDPFETDFNWSSNGGNISENGLFSSSEPGIFTITVTSGSFSETATITVSNIPAELTSIQITPSTITILINETVQLTAEGFDQYENPYETDIVWSTNDGIISQNGIFSSGNIGIYTITATSGNISETATVTVSETPSELISIQIAPQVNTIYINEELQLTAQGFDQNGESLNISDFVWNSNGTISQNGLFSATESGKFTVTAAHGDIVDEIIITVLDLDIEVETPDVDMEIDEDTTSLNLTDSFTIYPNPSNGQEIHLTGINDNTNINVYDVLGKLIKSENVSGVNSINIGPNELDPGFYVVIVSIRSPEKVVLKNFKLIVN